MFDFKNILGKNVKHLRDKKHLSQDALSELVNLSEKSINYIENGRNFASPETLSSLCESLECLPFELFRINQLTNSENEEVVKANICKALNSCDIYKLRNIEKYIFNMVLDNEETPL